MLHNLLALYPCKCQRSTHLPWCSLPVNINDEKTGNIHPQPVSKHIPNLLRKMVNHFADCPLQHPAIDESLPTIGGVAHPR
ncbi:hypothetical protein CCHOA_09335 [Corynebacterium choanae]|uniref:Uncharacterized protein n=1 Tax=Corynebacterium choanae TaxID=1862358 RepID=A0A3G6JC52_9CORY|nr:hypothetical protein CCHOA_09335 [Corynebacterium choanae]